MKAVWVQQEYYADYLRAAERDRLAAQAGRAGGTPRLVRQALAWLGRRLVAWGSSLQRRYEPQPSRGDLRGIGATL